MILGFIQIAWILIVIITIFLKPKYSIGLYLAYVMLVPYLNLRIGNIEMHWNFVNIVMLLGICLFLNKKTDFNFDVKPFFPFIIYYAASLFIMLFQDGVPFEQEINMWRQSSMNSLILPFVLWNYIRYDKDSYILYRRIFILCIFVIVLYALSQTLTPGQNPYLYILSEINNERYLDFYYEELGGGRMFGRISSVYPHPMLFGAVLGFSLIYILKNRNVLKRFFFIFIVVVIVIDVFVCGVRSALGAFLVASVFFFIKNRDSKMLIGGMFFAICGYFALMSVPLIADYASSIFSFNNDSHEVKGSSVEMRLEQLMGTIEEIRNCPIFGKGFCWTKWYVNTYGDHPVCWTFESLLFVILANSGMFGVVLWTYMVVKIYRYNKNYEYEHSLLLNILLVFYLSFSFITGEYGFMQYYIIFYIMLLSSRREIIK